MTKLVNTFFIISLLLLAFLPSIAPLDSRVLDAVDDDDSGSDVKEPDPEECFKDGYYDCDLCFCGLTDIPLYISMTLRIMSLLVSLVIVAGYISIKEMREQPGDIVFAVALCNLVFSGTAIFELVQDDEELFLNDEIRYCIIFGCTKTLIYFLVHFYNVSFSVFFLNILRGSLKSQHIPTIVYHIFPFLAMGFTWYNIGAHGAFGLNILGMCGMKTTKGFAFPVIYYGLIVFSTTLLTCFTKQYLPKNDKISNLRNIFLRFYFKLIIVLIGNYLLNASLDSLTGYVTSKFAQGDSTYFTVQILQKLALAKNIVLHFTSFLLPAARILDPLMRQHWKRMFQSCLPSYRRRSTSRFMEDARVSLDLAAVQKQLQKKSYIFQFQHNRRVQVVYAVLSGIHYFWRMKAENLEKSEIRKSKGYCEDSDLYEQQAYNKEYFPIDQDTLRNVIPELYDEIKERDYDFSEGTFTAHASEIFARIIRLDEIGRGISISLDLKENFTRILKSGVNGGGRSGEFFFFSSDNKIIIKTISTAELNTLLKILPAYLQHFKANPDSIIAKIYGVFTFQARSPNERYHLILMRNINGMPSTFVKRKYDLKGSTSGRRAVKEKDIMIEELQYKSDLKDLDFDRFEKKVHVSPEISQLLIETVKKDAAFLESQNLLDYSLALYLVDKKNYSSAKNSLYIKSNPSSLSDVESDGGDGRTRSIREEGDSLVSIRSTQEDLYYHLGIIDYLIPFNWKKKLELFVRKSLACNPNLNISVQRPGFYSKRFIKYMEKIFAIAHDENRFQSFITDTSSANKYL